MSSLHQDSRLPVVAPLHSPGERSGEAPGQPFGPYELLRLLGRGGQGQVWLASREGHEDLIALKILDRRQLGHGGQRRFAREAEVLGRIQHPAVCPLIDSGVIGGVPYIALEYIPGENLEERLCRDRDAGRDLYVDLSLSDDDDTSRCERGGLPDRSEVFERAHLIEAAARGLHAVHAAHVLHRDLKPANLLIRPDGSPVLVDFGIARDDAHSAQNLTLAGEIFGTPTYMSPEQRCLLDARVGPRSDVYSLAVTLFEALTLKRPLREGVGVVLIDAHDVNPAVPRALSAVLGKALEPHPEHRYASAADFADDLRRALLGQRTCASRGSFSQRLRAASRTPLLALFGFLCLTLGFVAGVLASGETSARGPATSFAAERQTVLTSTPTPGAGIVESEPVGTEIDSERLRDAMRLLIPLRPAS